jgi:sugar O-acyltransferase (sialic acid O-acetyltransferase NeuD family)
MRVKNENPKIAIIGAGGFAREVLDIVLEMGDQQQCLPGFFVDDFESGTSSQPLIKHITFLANQDIRYFIAIGDCDVRRRIDLDMGQKSGIGHLRHSSATFGSKNIIGEGSIFAAGSRLTTNIQTGRHFHLNLNSTVGHDSFIGDYVTVFPGVNISGNVVIGEKTTIGTGSSILPGVRIGSGCFIGAGAVVTQDVEDGQTVVGVPARPMTKKTNS